MRLGFNILVFLSVSFVAMGSFAQVETITKDEYVAARKAAFEATAKQIRRVTTTTIRWDDGKRNGSETLIEEFMPPDKVRTLFMARGGSKVTTNETIEVGDVKFKRVNAGIWSTWIRTERPLYELRGVPGANEPKEIIHHTSIKTNLNGRAVFLLSRASNKAYGFLAGTEQKRIWIDQEGLVIKSEHIIRQDEVSDVVEKTVATYEYNPKGLKIEAPIKLSRDK